ncbi:DUF2917 domain-containing protein [Roseimicrobium sp. ORNL1]|uniref:DUF2917 domain-containing protein n=1 Tax=Roseimicrobium sp. ORNL1 TaxID=2711231 RepID=UPI0013E1CCFE|nr:DUF2917 domain-containing protein [Roseimicrobium sp. ORNL1]QIF04406.1 DUF2917 domain-containing protein [Roseimicrobium sp. ORNL1]
MNTSSLSAQPHRLSTRTTVEGVFHRIGQALEKLWSLSGRVSVPATTCSTEMAHLPRGMVLTLDQSDGVTGLELIQGTVWITGTPARGDVVLGPGEVYEFGNRWPYVVEALSDSEFIASGSRSKKSPVISGAI